MPGSELLCLAGPPLAAEVDAPDLARLWLRRQCGEGDLELAYPAIGKPRAARRRAGGELMGCAQRGMEPVPDDPVRVDDPVVQRHAAGRHIERHLDAIVGVHRPVMAGCLGNQVVHARLMGDECDVQVLRIAEREDLCRRMRFGEMIRGHETAQLGRLLPHRGGQVTLQLRPRSDDRHRESLGGDGACARCTCGQHDDAGCCQSRCHLHLTILLSPAGPRLNVAHPSHSSETAYACAMVFFGSNISSMGPSCFSSSHGGS